MSIKILRTTLFISAPFNIFAAYVLLVPDGFVGQFIGLPEPVPIAYKVFLSFLIGYFGLVYTWMALQPQIDRPLLAVAAIAKNLTFVMSVGLWLLGHGTGLGVLMASGDLVFGVIWIWWLVGAPTNPMFPN